VHLTIWIKRLNGRRAWKHQDPGVIWEILEKWYSLNGVMMRVAKQGVFGKGYENQVRVYTRALVAILVYLCVAVLNIAPVSYYTSSALILCPFMKNVYRSRSLAKARSPQYSLCFASLAFTIGRSL